MAYSEASLAEAELAPPFLIWLRGLGDNLALFLALRAAIFLAIASASRMMPVSGGTVGVIASSESAGVDVSLAT